MDPPPPSMPPVVVDSRISKVLELRTDSVPMLEALDAISEFYTANTLEARRSLRQDLELQNITLAKKFLQEYSDIKERVSTVENISLNLKKSCNELTNRIISADENMKLFMSKAAELEANVLDTKARMSGASVRNAGPRLWEAWLSTRMEVATQVTPNLPPANQTPVHWMMGVMEERLARSSSIGVDASKAVGLPSSSLTLLL